MILHPFQSNTLGSRFNFSDLTITLSISGMIDWYLFLLNARFPTILPKAIPMAATKEAALPPPGTSLLEDNSSKKYSMDCFLKGKSNLSVFHCAYVNK